MRYANKLFTTCLTECCVAKKVSQPLQRHLTVCRFWLLWSLVRCCSKWSCMPKIREQFCHWKESKYNKKSSRKRHCVNVEESLFQFITSGSYPAAVVFHQVELYSLNAAIVTACVDLRVEQSTTEKQVSSVYSSLSCMNRCQASLYLKSKKKNKYSWTSFNCTYHTFMYSHAHHHVTVTAIYLQPVMRLNTK